MTTYATGLRILETTRLKISDIDIQRMTIAADPKHLGVKIGFMTILHTWSQTFLLHPHLQCVIPGGGLSQEERAWISCRKNFFLPVRLLSPLYRRLFIELFTKTFNQDRLN